MIDWSDTSIVNSIIKQAEEYRLRVEQFKTYTPEEVVQAVKTIAEFLNMPYPVVWLGDLKKPQDLAKPPDYDLALRVSHFFTKMNELRNLISSISSTAWGVCSGYHQSYGKAPDTVFGAITLNTRDTDRIIDAVNQSGLISTRFRKFIGSIVGFPDCYKLNRTYARSQAVIRNLKSYNFAYSVGPHVLQDHHNQDEVQEVIKACKIISTSLLSILQVHSKIVLVELPYVYKNSRDQIHREDGPAVYFPKLKTGFYYLNNVKLPRDIVVTPADKLESNRILKTQNAETRRELVRKIGIERILTELKATVMDEKDNYQLVNLNLGDRRDRPYLKMLNPSTGDWHIEGVEPEATTVEAALAYRNGTTERPQILT